jgi:hypothetical protein
MKSLTELNVFSAQSVAYDDQGTGAQTLADRYQINGLIDTARPVMENIEKICSAAGSWLSYDINEGKWGVVINTTGTSVASFDDTNILGSITVSGTGINELYNSVKVEFPHRELRDSADFVTIEIADGDRNANEEDNTLNLTYDTINEPVQAQLLGFIELKQSRVDLAIAFQTDYSQINIKAGDIIDVTNERFSFTNKLFRVISTTEIQDDDGAIRIEISALEYDADVYSTADLYRYTRTDENGIITIGSIGTPGTPQVTKVEKDVRPRIIIESTVPTGVVEALEFWLTDDINLAEANRSYRLIAVEKPAGGGVFTSGQALVFEYDSITTGDFIVKTRGVNATTTGPFSTPSGLIDFNATQITNAIGPDTVTLDAAGQIATLLAANFLMKQVDDLFKGATTSTGMFSKIFDIFKDVTGIDLVGEASSGELVVASNLGIADEGTLLTNQTSNINFQGSGVEVTAAGNNVTVVIGTGELPEGEEVGDILIWNGTEWVRSSAEGSFPEVTPEAVVDEGFAFGGRWPSDRNDENSSINVNSSDQAPITGPYYLTNYSFRSALQTGTGNAKLYKSDGTLVQTIAASSATIDKNVIQLPFSNRDLGTDYYITVDKGFVTHCGRPNQQIKPPILNTDTSETQYDRVAASWSFNTPLYEVIPTVFVGGYPAAPTTLPTLSSFSLVKDFYYSETETYLKTVNPETGDLINPPEQATRTVNTKVTDYSAFIDQQTADTAAGLGSIGKVKSLLRQTSASASVGCPDSYLELVFSNGGAKVGSGNLYIKKFSDDTTATTINVVSGKDSNDGTIIFDRLSLQSGIQYYINYDEGAFKHTESDCGVSFNAPALTNKLSTFTIEAAPAVASFDVKSDPVEVGNPNKINPQSEITLVFNKPVRFRSTGTVSIYEADGTLHQAISIADVLSNQFINRVLRFTGTAVNELSIKLSDTPNINLSGTSLIINPTKDFKLATTYYVQVSSSALEDSCGTDWTGISDTTTVRFTTDPGPTATVADITNASDGIEVEFDRTVIASAGTAKIYNSSDAEIDSFGMTDQSITLS